MKTFKNEYTEYEQTLVERIILNSSFYFAIISAVFSFTVLLLAIFGIIDLRI